MQKTIIILLLITTACISLNAQRTFKKYYQDQINESEQFLGAYADRIRVKTAEGAFVEKVYYPEKKALTHYVTYANRLFKERDGLYKEWYDDGRPWKEGQYKNNQAEGTWTYYPFDNGGRTRRGTYLEGKMEGTWVWLDSLGRVIEERNYQQDELHGVSKVYDTDGQLAISRVYEHGELISEDYFETSNAIDTVKMIEQMPMLKGCDDIDIKARKQCSDMKMLKSIYTQIKYPRFARENGIEGTAIFSFVVEKNGSISNITTMRGICADIEAECLRVIRLLPEWNPGMNDGEAVKVQFKLPVKFRLE